MRLFIAFFFFNLTVFDVTIHTCHCSDINVFNSQVLLQAHSGAMRITVLLSFQNLINSEI